MTVAKGREKVAKAQLKARYKPSKEADYDVNVARQKQITTLRMKSVMTKPAISKMSAKKKQKPLWCVPNRMPNLS